MISRNRPLVSIIMPVYNAGQYLKSSIGSLLSQNYKNIEIICVDDGSTDNTLDILREYANNDSRICLITQNNMHAGIARNNGLKSAKGTYVVFLDADDIFAKDMISTLVDTMLEHEVDITVFNYFSFSNNIHLKKRHEMPFCNVVKTPVEISNQIFQINTGAPWHFFYSMKYIKNSGLQFQGTINTNDIYFTRLASIYCNKMYFLDRALVYYRVGNKNSLQRSINKNPTIFADALNAIIDKIMEDDQLKRYRDSLRQYTIDLFMTAIDRADSFDNLISIYFKATECFKKVGVDTNNRYVIDKGYVSFVNSILQSDYIRTSCCIYLSKKQEYVSKSTVEYRIGKKILQLLKIRKY